MKGFKNAGVLKMLRWQRNARGKETQDCTVDEALSLGNIEDILLGVLSQHSAWQ